MEDDHSTRQRPMMTSELMHLVGTSSLFVLLEIYGYSSQSARLHAIDFTTQLQMINIPRDAREDLIETEYIHNQMVKFLNVSLDKLSDDMLVESPNWMRVHG